MGKATAKKATPTKVAKKSNKLVVKKSKHNKSAKKNTSETQKEHRKDKDFDFSKLSHKVVQGSYKTWQGEHVGGESEGKIKLKLLKNARGKPVVRPFEMEFYQAYVEELNSYDMIGFSEDVEDGAEDQDLIDYEKETWTCVCGASNTNDGSYCNAIINGVVCNKIRPNTSTTTTGWGSLFANLFANKVSSFCFIGSVCVSNVGMS